jgi:hypothetical protein
VRHAEPNSGTGCGATPCQVNDLKWQVLPGPGNAYDPDNPLAFSPQESVPLYDPFAAPCAPPNCYWSQDPARPAAHAFPISPAGTYTFGAVNSDPADAARLTDPVVRQQQAKLTSSLPDAEAVNGGEIRFTASSNASGSSPATYVLIDAIQLTVEYRPPTQLRPLRGCATIRTMDETGPAQFRGTSFIHNGDGVASPPKWLSPPGRNDYSYDETAGTTDNLECAVLKFESKSNDEGAKLHIVGSVYAPTAALDFAGKQNRASFVTDGIVARHLTTLRWSEDASVAEPTPAYGCCPVQGGKRMMTFTAKQKSTGRVLATATVSVDDGDGSPGQIARAVTIESWNRGA